MHLKKLILKKNFQKEDVKDFWNFCNPYFTNKSVLIFGHNQ